MSRVTKWIQTVFQPCGYFPSAEAQSVGNVFGQNMLTGLGSQREHAPTLCLQGWGFHETDNVAFPPFVIRASHLSYRTTVAHSALHRNGTALRRTELHCTSVCCSKAGNCAHAYDTYRTAYPPFRVLATATRPASYYSYCCMHKPVVHVIEMFDARCKYEFRHISRCHSWRFFFYNVTLYQVDSGTYE